MSYEEYLKHPNMSGLSSDLIDEWKERDILENKIEELSKDKGFAVPVYELVLISTGLPIVCYLLVYRPFTTGFSSYFLFSCILFIISSIIVCRLYKKHMSEKQSTIRYELENIYYDYYVTRRESYLAKDTLFKYAKFIRSLDLDFEKEEAFESLFNDYYISQKEIDYLRDCK